MSRCFEEKSKTVSKKTIHLAAVISLFFAGACQAQGLLGVDAVSDYWENIPFSVGVQAQGGWSSNINSSSEDEEGATFATAGVSLAYGSIGKRTNVRLGANFGVTYYPDPSEYVDETNYNTGAFLNVSRQMSPRLQFANNLYVSYEVEPEFSQGMTTAQRDGQYFNILDAVSLSYAWTRRLSMNASYSISGILYEGDALSATEDRFNHQAGLGLSYALSTRTSLLADYRFAITDYQNFGSDATSHFILVGLSHSFSPRLSGTVRVGVQAYDSDRSSAVSPYLEASLAYRISRRTQVSWNNRLGYEGAELGIFDSRYTFRTGLSASHQFTERLRGNAGIYYSYSLFDLSEGKASELEERLQEINEARDDVVTAAEAVGVELTEEQLAVFDIDEEDVLPSGDQKESQLSLNVGMAYRLFSNVDVTAGYSFASIDSNIDDREYDRHSVYMGVGAHF